jgi:uncharacterized membrane protein
LFYGIFSFYVGLLIDSYFYGKVTITPLNFYFFNISKNYAAEFGVNNWHWNFSNVLLLLLLLLLKATSFVVENYDNAADNNSNFIIIIIIIIVIITIIVIFIII